MRGVKKQAPATSIRIVLFDAVGTLIQPDPPVAQVYAAAGTRHGSRLTAAEIDERFQRVFPRHCDADATGEQRERQRWRDIVAEVFDDLPQAHEALFEELWEHFAQPCHWALFDDVAPAWRAVARAGLSIGIASNFDQRLLGICRQLPPLDQAEHVFQSAAVGFSKPHPSFFQAVQRQLDLSASSILLVGDSLEHDITPARAAGWRAVRIDRRSSASGPDLIRSLTHIPI